MPTNDDIRLTHIESRLDKYDEMIDKLHDIVIKLEAQSETSYKWITGIVAFGSTTVGAIAGVLVGHFVR